MATRDFDAFLADKAGVRPTFKVGGQEFTVKAKLPFKKFASTVTALSEEDDEVKQAEDFFSLVLVPGDRDRFFELLDAEGDDDGNGVVTPEQIGALMEWLMEHYTGKHRPHSDGSSLGLGSTSPQPNVVSLSARAS